jgi:hypothetical protein
MAGGIVPLSMQLSYWSHVTPSSMADRTQTAPASFAMRRIQEDGDHAALRQRSLVSY